MYISNTKFAFRAQLKKPVGCQGFAAIICINSGFVSLSLVKHSSIALDAVSLSYLFA